MKTLYPLLLSSLFLFACEGPPGPEGAPGRAGLDGAPGAKGDPGYAGSVEFKEALACTGKVVASNGNTLEVRYERHVYGDGSYLASCAVLTPAAQYDSIFFYSAKYKYGTQGQCTVRVDTAGAANNGEYRMQYVEASSQALVVYLDELDVKPVPLYLPCVKINPQGP